jgi:hypothetical protein
MDDYSALAYRIAGGVADVRGCLILSRDGLILGSYPDDETAVKPAWVRFASLGDPERSFVEFGDQVWVYVRRPAYGAFAVANAGIRPGLVIDQLEGILASAEESRNRRDTLRVPEATGASPNTPLTSFRPSANGAIPAVAPPADSPGARHWSRTSPPATDGSATDGSATDPVEEELAKVASGVGRSGDATPADGPSSDAGEVADLEADAATSDAEAAEEHDADTARDPAPDDAEGEGPDGASGTHNGKAVDTPTPLDLDADAEVDPVMLAKEFSGLLQVESGDDEVSS